MLDWWDWLLSDMWDDWGDFSPSIAWGNVATLTVAIVAIIVSARFNVLTLRRSGSQFDRQRRDQVIDKLRVEIAEYVSSLYARWRLSNLMEPMTRAGPDEASFRDAKTKFLQALPDALAVLQDFNRMGMRGLSILMLTNDATIRRLVGSINNEIMAELNDFRAVTPLFTDVTDSGSRLTDNAQNERAERIRRENSVYDQSNELMLYCINNFAQGVQS
ncbi:hypothetical protein A5641_24520 [Mycobacterium sp. 1554424.7]|nr:hypothetical protein A5641_24520 [Mycobacterium sp. 1554424.7]